MLVAISCGGSRGYGTNKAMPRPSRIPHPQMIKVSGRLVGTRTPDLHRVNSCTDDAQLRKNEQQSAPKDGT